MKEERKPSVPLVASASKQQRSVEIQLDRNRVARRWTLGDPTSETFRGREQLTWGFLADNLSLRAKALDNPIEKDKFLRLEKLSRAAQGVFGSLGAYMVDNPESLSSVDTQRLKEVTSERFSSAQDDSYPRHGARCASYLVDMGITDPVAFLTAGLHDISELLIPTDQANSHTRLSDVVRHQISSSLRKSQTPEQIADLLDGLTTFHEVDVYGKETSRILSERLVKDEGMPFGNEFTLDEFVKMKKWMWSDGTDRVISSVNYDGGHKRSDFGVEKSGKKFDPLIAILRRATDTRSRSSALKKNRLPPVPISSELAYLAAALDHSYFPKMGTHSIEAQRVALGILANHLPIYQAYGDPMRRVALEIVYRAFMPDKFANLYTVADAMSQRAKGEYFEMNAKAYARKIHNLVSLTLHDSEQPISMLSDVEWEARRLNILAGANSSYLLRDYEAYCPGFVESQKNMADPEAHMRTIDMKSGSSVMDKAVKLLSSPEVLGRIRKDVRQKFGDGGQGFGSLDFWKCFLPLQHDILRTMIIFGEASEAQFMRTFTEHFGDMSYDPEAIKRDPSKSRDYGIVSVVDNGTNHANSYFDLRSERDRYREFFESKRREVYNILYAPAGIQTPSGVVKPINCEIQLTPARAYAEREIRGESHRGPYKWLDRARLELVDEGGLSTYQQALATKFADLELMFRTFRSGEAPSHQENNDSRDPKDQRGNVYRRSAGKSKNFPEF